MTDHIIGKTKSVQAAPADDYVLWAQIESDVNTRDVVLYMARLLQFRAHTDSFVHFPQSEACNQTVSLRPNIGLRGLPPLSYRRATC